MRGYIVFAIFLHIIVDYLLIMASKRMLSGCIHPVRAFVGALAGGIYCTGCLLPGMLFLHTMVWYGVSLGIVCLLSFGLNREAVKVSALYCLLRIAVDGISGSGNKPQSLIWASFFCVVCLTGFYGCRQKYLPIELCCGDKKAKLQGLVDTGHTLRDPVTGSAVLIVGADIAQCLTGLTLQQISNPVESMGKIPGLRLIPYTSVGRKSGLLLAMPMQKGKIGNRRETVLVAFAPQILDEAGKFQALIGGNL